MTKYVACDLCFKDYGLRSEIFRGRRATKDECIHCGNTNGTKVTYEELKEACSIFFQRGSYSRSVFGGANVLMLFKDHYDDILVSNALIEDLKILSTEFKINVGYASPRLSQVGENDWLIKLYEFEGDKRNNVIDKVINRCKQVDLNKEEHFFRIRVNIPNPDLLNPDAFDSPPKQTIDSGRFNLCHKSVFYGAFHVETCLNESRVAVDDDIFVARLKPNQKLKLIDFTKIASSNNEDDFTDLNRAIAMLFSAGNHSYPITQSFSEVIYQKGFDGVIYPSFFNQVRDANYRNIVLFGHPIAEKKIEVVSINIIQQKSIRYEFTYGPVIKTSD